MDKKILAITHQLDRTGAPIVLLNLLKLLSQNGYEIDVITLKNGDLQKDFKELGFNVSLWEKILSQRSEFIEVCLNYDLVICNTLVSFEAVHALKTTSVPVIWWIHEGVHIFDYLLPLLPDISSLPQNIHPIAVSPLVRRLVLKYYKKEIPILSIPVEDIPSLGKEKGDKFRFLTMGMYSKAKGQDVLARAIKALPDNIRENSEFFFCGNEETYDPEVLGPVRMLEQSENNVHILGSLPHNKALEMLDRVDCLIVPSREDPIPTVAVEAFMKETLCICTYDCGISDYMTNGKDGIVCESKDEKALKNAIERVMDRSFPLDAVRKKGRDIFIDKYSEKRVIPRFLDLVDNLSYNNRLIIVFDANDVMDTAACGLKDAFWELGYEIFLFDISDVTGSLSRLGPFVEKPVKAVITFNSLGYNMELRPNSIIWDDLNIPVINILMDNPAKHREILLNSPKVSIVLSLDIEYADYIADSFPNIPVSGFIASGGIELSGPKKKIKDREYDVVFFGDASENPENRLLLAIAENGINLWLFGSGWENCNLTRFYNVHFHDKISANEALTVMQEAKIVLSGITGEEKDTKGYVFNGMLQGALTVANESDYLIREFAGKKNQDGSDERELILFSLSEIEELPTLIKEMINNPCFAQEIADRGYHKAKANHTWKSRAKEICEDILKQL